MKSIPQYCGLWKLFAVSAPAGKEDLLTLVVVPIPSEAVELGAQEQGGRRPDTPAALDLQSVLMGLLQEKRALLAVIGTMGLILVGRLLVSQWHRGSAFGTPAPATYAQTTLSPPTGEGLSKVTISHLPEAPSTTFITMLFFLHRDTLTGWWSGPLMLARWLSKANRHCEGS